jgi:hypothetical protein
MVEVPHRPVAGEVFCPVNRYLAGTLSGSRGGRTGRDERVSAVESKVHAAHPEAPRLLQNHPCPPSLPRRLNRPCPPSEPSLPAAPCPPNLPLRQDHPCLTEPSSPPEPSLTAGRVDRPALQVDSVQLQEDSPWHSSSPGNSGTGTRCSSTAPGHTGPPEGSPAPSRPTSGGLPPS